MPDVYEWMRETANELTCRFWTTCSCMDKQIIEISEIIANHALPPETDQAFTCAECGYLNTFKASNPMKCTGCGCRRWVLGHDTGIFERKQLIAYWQKLAENRDVLLMDLQRKLGDAALK